MRRSRTRPGPVLSILLLAIVLAFLFLAGPSSRVRQPYPQPSAIENDNSIISRPSLRFYEAAVTVGNAKVMMPNATTSYFAHHYESMYAKYLDGVPETTPLRILEIGLGCDMPKEWGGVGNSLQPAVPLGGFDMIVDDGGHHPVDQATTLKGLWPALRPGGLYVVEDLLTSYWTKYAEAAADPGAVIPYLKTALDEMNCHSAMPEETSPQWREFCGGDGSGLPRLGKQFLSLDCAAEICAIVKHRSPAPFGYTF